jgi:hypothetical protein
LWIGSQIQKFLDHYCQVHPISKVTKYEIIESLYCSNLQFISSVFATQEISPKNITLSLKTPALAQQIIFIAK